MNGLRMTWTLIAAIVMVLGVSVITNGFQSGNQEGSRTVIVNRTRLSDELISALEQRYRVRIPDGNYWYDNFSGAWGLEGRETLGFTFAGLELGGRMRSDASNGNTRVFINGRELHIRDVLSLQQLGTVLPGRYWVDSRFNCGYEGGPAMFNLLAIANAKAKANNSNYRMYDSGIGRVMSDGHGFIGFISGDSSATRN